MSTSAVKAPDHKHYLRCLSELGWTEVRNTKHGTLFRSPDGQHHFNMSHRTGSSATRGQKVEIGKLKRAGGEALELARMLTGTALAAPKLHRSRADLALPTPSSMQRHADECDCSLCANGFDLAEKGGYDKLMAGFDSAQELKVVDIVIGAISLERDAAVKDAYRRAERVLATTEESPVPTATEDKASTNGSNNAHLKILSEEAFRRYAAEVVAAVLAHYDGDITMAKLPEEVLSGRARARSVLPGLMPYLDCSPRYASVKMQAADDLGWTVSEWPQGVGSRTGRGRITVTEAGRAAAREMSGVLRDYEARPQITGRRRKAEEAKVNGTANGVAKLQDLVSNGDVTYSVEEVAASVRDTPPPVAAEPGPVPTEAPSGYDAQQELADLQELVSIYEQERDAAKAERDQALRERDANIQERHDLKVFYEKQKTLVHAYQNKQIGIVATLLEQADGQSLDAGKHALLAACQALLTNEMKDCEPW